MQLYNLIRFGLRENFRIPIAFFFNIIFSILFLIIFMTMIGNIPIGFGDLHFIDKYFMIALILGMGPIAFVSLATSISALKNEGAIERYMLFGISPLKFIISQIIVHMIIAYIQLTIIYLISLVFYSISTPSFIAVLSFLFQYTLVLFTCLLMGASLGIITTRSAQAQIIGMTIMFLSYFLGGAFGDLENPGNIITRLIEFYPFAFLATYLFETWALINILNIKMVLITSVHIIIFGGLLIAFSKAKITKDNAWVPNENNSVAKF